MEKPFTQNLLETLRGAQQSIVIAQSNAEKRVLKLRREWEKDDNHFGDISALLSIHDLLNSRVDSNVASINLITLSEDISKLRVRRKDAVHSSINDIDMMLNEHVISLRQTLDALLQVTELLNNISMTVDIDHFDEHINLLNK